MSVENRWFEPHLLCRALALARNYERPLGLVDLDLHGPSGVNTQK